MTDLRRLQDVQLGDENLIENYRNYFNNRQIDNAHNLINTNKYKSYVLQAEWMNNIKTKIEQVEEYSDVEITQNLNNKNTEFQTNIDRLLYIQEYDSVTQYYENNLVSYNNNIYFCINNSLGNLPTNTAYWLKIGLIGEKGQYGLGTNYRGFWNSATSYNKYDLVSYENNLYVATENNVGTTPLFGKYLNDSLYLNSNLYLGLDDKTATWFLLTRTEVQPIYVFPTDYRQLQSDSIFFAEVQ